AGCSHRATWRIQNRRGSSRRWMKVQWQVSVTHCIGEIVLGGNLETDTLGQVNRLISQMSCLSRVTGEPCRITAIHSRRNGFDNLRGPRRARDIVLYLRIRSLGLKSDSM
ncbi:hypothetical protein GFL43_34920, partial [Rhizobium laguerreae]|nr:hypothetical protein [Rhizobium laguerreae]